MSEPSVPTLDGLPDDIFLKVITACGGTAFEDLLFFEQNSQRMSKRVLFGDDVPRLKVVIGLECLSKAVLHQLYRLRPLVGVQSMAVMRRHFHGPWRVVLLHKGELTAALVEWARQGHVRSIQARFEDSVLIQPWKAVAKRVVPELLGAGCSLRELDMSLRDVAVIDKMDDTWVASFGTAAVCSAELRRLRLDCCVMRGPLPELVLPALLELDVSCNQLVGGLTPLQSCTALQELYLQSNELAGGLEPLRGCTALLKLSLHKNKFTGGLEPLQGCTQLQMLVLDGNQITGGLEPLRGCTALKVLGLGGNQLCGGLEPLKGLTELQKLYISKNQLSGDLKPLACCTGLTVLALSNNNLIGDLEPLRGCAALTKVYGTHNQLEGTLEPFEGRAALHELYLSNNRLQGTLRPLGGCTSLMMLHLYDNQLTGGVEHLMRSTLLQELFLADNHLTVGEEDRAHFERQCELSCI